MRTLVAVAAVALALAVSAGPAVGAAPRISVQPASSPPGQLVTVAGLGFCASAGCSGVDVQIAGVPVASGVSVSEDGTFMARGRVPGGLTGEVGVTAAQRLADGSESTAFTLLEVIALLKPSTTGPASTEPAPSTIPRVTPVTPSTTPEHAATTRKEKAPAATTPAQDEPVASGPVQTEPADARPAESKPAETTPAQATTDPPAATTDTDAWVTREATSPVADDADREWLWLGLGGGLLLGALAGLSVLRRARRPH